MRNDSRLVVILKWSGMFLGVSGTVLAAMNKWPLAPVVLILNCAVWAAVGRAWREPTVWITNSIACLISLVLLIAELARRAF